jgi:dTDP-4-amino-4,6-dideoxygalactose transaminase
MEGINSRLDGLQAAILNVKLNHIENWTKLRQQHGAHYDQILADVSGITLPKVRPECEHVYHLYVVRSDRRDELRSHLKSNEIPTVVNYPMPLPLYKAYEHLEHKREEFSISAKHADQILSIPIYPEMPPEDRVRVADTIQGSMA